MPISKAPRTLILDERSNFNESLNSKTSKYDKLIGITKKSSISFPKNALLAIYKSFIRPQLDYADIIYDKPNNWSLKTFNRAFNAITSVIQGTSKKRVYRELGLESLTDRHRTRKLVFFIKL